MLMTTYSPVMPSVVLCSRATPISSESRPFVEARRACQTSLVN